MTTQAGVYARDNCMGEGTCQFHGCGATCVLYSPRIAYAHYPACNGTPCPTSANGNSAYAQAPACGGLMTANGC